MKTIDVKSMLIGFLLCAVGFLTIGATKIDSQIGRYEGYGDKGINYLVDTTTGETFRMWNLRNHNPIVGEKWVSDILFENQLPPKPW